MSNKDVIELIKERFLELEELDKVTPQEACIEREVLNARLAEIKNLLWKVGVPPVTL